MRHIDGHRLAMAVAAMWIAIGAACTSSSPTPTASEAFSMTISNIHVTTPTPKSSPTPGERVGNVSQGEVLYTQQCSVCHGSGGEGGLALALNTPEFQQSFAEDDTLVAFLRTGRGGMPAYGSSRLSDEQVSDIIAYLRSLQ